MENSFSQDKFTLSGDFTIKQKKVSSIIKIGDSFIINIEDKKFNYFQRKMMKLFFGFDVENIK